MIEILLVVLFLIGLAKRPKKSFRAYLRGNIQQTLALSTLAANTLISVNVSGNVTEPAWCSSVRLTWSLAQFTQGVDEGPVTVGVAHSDYTSAEIEQTIENSGSWEQGDLIAKEQSSRKIRIVGTFSQFSESESGALVLNDGKPITTKCGWKLSESQTVKFWAYNEGAQALTTGSDLSVLGHANLWPSG